MQTERWMCAWMLLMSAGMADIAFSADNNQEPAMEKVIGEAARIAPSPRQRAWQRDEFAAFVHFGVNTFSDREWGDGTENPASFNPTALDARQWAAACKAAGMRKLILTTKHHDGFCLWPSKFTEHSVKHSPWRNGQGDLVKEVSEACKEAGLRFGVYLSPWDRHEKTYGDSPAYNQYFLNQLRELLTQYGPLAEVWFDGACGEGPNGKKQVYDWEAYFALIRELQPEAVISISGPDVRWCGNEAGETRESEWSVVPADIKEMDKDLGSREALLAAVKRGVALKWRPAQVDVSIRPGWFYHTKDDAKVKTLDTLLDIYYGSVGGNAELLLNIPPDTRGLFHENDVRQLTALGRVLQATFDEDLCANATASASANKAGFEAKNIMDGDAETYWTTEDGAETAEIEFRLAGAKTFNRALLQEAIQVGQRVESFALDAWVQDAWKPVAKATVIGYKRIVTFDAVQTDRVRLRITASRVAPTLARLGLFQAPVILAPPTASRDADGKVTLSAPPDVEVRYWISTWKPEAAFKKYTAPFAFAAGGTMKMMSVVPEGSDAVLAGSRTAEQAFPPLSANAPLENDAAPAAFDQEAWKTFQQPVTPVARQTDALPLSDQKNEGNWTAYAPLTDEFNGDALNPAVWWPVNPTWLGRQPALFKGKNVFAKDGMLNLRMSTDELPSPELQKQGYGAFSSAAVKSKKTVRYGYFEVRSRSMSSAGSSSFWFYNDEADWWTEIDVFELSGKKEFSDKMHFTLHSFRTPAEDRHWNTYAASYVSSAPLCDDYHVYGLEWDEQWLRFYFDGVLVRQGPNTHWHQPLYLNFDSETMPEWFGLPNPAELPSLYSIDYVRVWKKAPSK